MRFPAGFTPRRAAQLLDRAARLTEPERRQIQDITSSEGVCRRESDPEIFFPIGPADARTIEAARAVCHSCPLLDDCLALALAQATLCGVFGGVTEWDRQRMLPVVRRRREQIAAAEKAKAEKAKAEKDAAAAGAA
jgi:WhiB family redox-sensing transcriptional regulator